MAVNKKAEVYRLNIQTHCIAALITLESEVDMYSRRTVPICLPSTRDRYLTQPGRAGEVKLGTFCRLGNNMVFR